MPDQHELSAFAEVLNSAEKPLPGQLLGNLIGYQAASI
jgi:hypothetical protein